MFNDDNTENDSKISVPNYKSPREQDNSNSLSE